MSDSLNALNVSGYHRGKSLTLSGDFTLKGWAELAHRMRSKLGTGWTLTDAWIGPRAEVKVPLLHRILGCYGRPAPKNAGAGW